MRRLHVPLVLVVLLLFASALPVQAIFGVGVNFSGAYPGARMKRMTFVSCVAQSVVDVLYNVHPFYVEVAGLYTLETTWAFDGIDDDTVLVLYANAFDPASPSANCIASNDDWGGSWLSHVAVSLTPGVQYYAVVQTYNVGATTGSYTGVITGAAPKLGLLPGAPAPSVERPPDDRLNWRMGDMYATLYLRSDDAGEPVLHVYCVNEESQGYLGAVWGADDLALPAELPASNALVAGVDICKVPVNLYLLTTGEWALHIGPNAVGDVEALVWRGFPPSGMYEVRYNITR